MAAPPLADSSLRQFTMKLRADHRAQLVSTANDAGVTASDWVRALILLSREDPALAARVVERARTLRRASKTGH
jgi:hypothetical protein